MLEENQESDDIDLPFHFKTLILRMRNRWKMLVVGVTLALIIGVTLAMLFGQRVYQAEAVLHYRPSEVEQKPPNLLTLLNMVKLQENLEAVRERLGIQARLTTLSGAYKVDVRRDTELLVIQARAGSAEEASRLAVALRDVFLESQESKRRAKLKSALKALERRFEEVTSELKKADAALQEFTVKNQIVDLDKEAQWYLEELTSLQIMLEEAQVQRTSVRQKAENIDRIVGDLKERVSREKAESQTEFDSLGDINIRVQRLRAAIHDDKTQRAGEALLEQKRLELERAESLKAKGLLSDSEYEKKLAAYKSQKALTVDTQQVSQWKEQVDELNSRAIPKGTTTKAQSGPILQEMMLKAFDIELELVTQDKRVQSLQKAVKNARKKLNGLPQLQRTFAALTREVKAIEVQKVDLEQRVGDTRRLLSSRLQDFVVASEPKMRHDPVSSNRRLLALAVALIGCLGWVALLVARELLDPRSLSGPELGARTCLPVFGILPARKRTGVGREENLLARSLPQSGVYVVTTPHLKVDLEQACLRMGKALSFQGIPTVLVGMAGRGTENDLSQFFLNQEKAPEPQSTSVDGPSLVFRGQETLAPSFFRSLDFQQYLETLSSQFRCVLILAPDLESSVSADILAEQSDGVLVVVDTRCKLATIKRSTRRIMNRVTGLILDGVTAPYSAIE